MFANVNVSRPFGFPDTPIIPETNKTQYIQGFREVLYEASSVENHSQCITVDRSQFVRIYRRKYQRHTGRRDLFSFATRNLVQYFAKIHRSYQTLAHDRTNKSDR